MNKPPAFQFYASDWLGSSQIALMSAEEERGYLRLLLHQWSSPGCCLPDDDEVLARLSMMGQGWLKNGCPLVRRCFVPNPDQPGTIRNEKLYQVYLRQLVWREKSAAGGRKSAQQRKLRQMSDPRVVQPPLEANGQPKANTPASSLQPPNEDPPKSPKGKKKGNPVDAETARGMIPETLQCECFTQAILDWLKYKTERAEKITPIGLKRLLTRLAKMGPTKAAEAIDYSMGQQWAGIFEERTSNGRTNSDQSGRYRTGGYTGQDRHYRPKAKAPEDRPLMPGDGTPPEG